MGGKRAAGAGLTALAAILWGCWPLVLRPSGLTAPQQALVSIVVMASPLPFVIRRQPFHDRGAVLALLLLGVADAGSIALYFAALSRGPVAVAVLTHYLAPILVTLAAPLVTGERWSRRVAVAAPASLLGLALVIWRPGDDASLVTAGLGAASACFFASFYFAAKRAGRAFPATAVLALHAVVSALVLLAVFGRSAVPGPGPGALRVALGALVCGVLATLLFLRALTLIPTAVAGALSYLEPLTAAIVGWAVFGETIDGLGLVGVAVILASGVAVATEA